jgi:hypothetical protein
VRFNPGDIQSASMVRGQLPLAPGAGATRMSDREARYSGRQPATRADNSFYSTRQATRLDRVPLESQRSALQESSRRTFGDPQGSSGFTGRVSGADRATGSDTGGWRRFGDSSGNTAIERNTNTAAPPRGVAAAPASGSSDSGSWRRFGDSTAASTATTGRGSDTSSTWRRMTETPNPPPRTIDRGINNRSGAASPNTFGSQGGRGSSVISAPPVVRERAAPRTEQRSAPSGGGGSRGGEGGGSRGSGHSGGRGR